MEGRIWPDRKESLGCLHDHLLEKHRMVVFFLVGGMWGRKNISKSKDQKRLLDVWRLMKSEITLDN